MIDSLDLELHDEPHIENKTKCFNPVKLPNPTLQYLNQIITYKALHRNTFGLDAALPPPSPAIAQLLLKPPTLILNENVPRRDVFNETFGAVGAVRNGSASAKTSPTSRCKLPYWAKRRKRVEWREVVEREEAEARNRK